jgi:hypothetical protein
MHLHIGLAKLYLILNDIEIHFQGTTVKYVKSYFAYLACFCIFGVFMYFYFIGHIIQHSIKKIYQKSKWKI